VVLGGASARLTSIKGAVVLLTGEDALRTRLLQEALAVELMVRGIPVVEQIRVDSAMATELARRAPTLADARAGGSSQADSSTLSPAEILPNALDLARAIGADTAFTGTIVERLVRVDETKRQSPPLESRQSADTVLVTAVSFQALDVPSGRLLFAAVVPFDGGATLIQAAFAMAQALEASRAGSQPAR
jgi:hypothetical protein